MFFSFVIFERSLQSQFFVTSQRRKPFMFFQHEKVFRTESFLLCSFISGP